MPEDEPVVIIKPETPFYRSPKILAFLAIPILAGIVFASVKYLPILTKKPQEQPQQITQPIRLASAVGIIRSLNTAKKSVVIMDEFTNQEITVEVSEKSVITEEGPLKALEREMPQEIISFSKDAQVLKAETKKVDFTQLKSGMRIQINAEVNNTNSWQAKNINIPFI